MSWGSWSPVELRKAESKRGQERAITFADYAANWVNARRKADGTPLGGDVIKRYRAMLRRHLKPSKEDTQKDPTISIDGKTALLGDMLYCRVHLDLKNLDRKDTAYDVKRAGIIDDYDDGYLTADEQNVEVLNAKGEDVTNRPTRSRLHRSSAATSTWGTSAMTIECRPVNPATTSASTAPSINCAPAWRCSASE